MAPTFFVCYRRDAWEAGAALYGALAERHGPDRVFKDITSLPLGQDWRREVATALGRSSHVLALIGPGWMAGVDERGLRNGQVDPVVFELTEALRRGCKVVPVLLGGQPMPPAHLLPVGIRGIVHRNAAHIRKETADTDIAGLVARLPQPTRRGPAPPPPPSWVGRLVALLVVAAVVVGALVFAPVLVSTVQGWLSPGPDPELVITPTGGPAGTDVTATATGFDPGETVEFLFQGRPLAEAVVAADGTVTGSIEVPSGPDGTWTVTAVQQRSTKYDNALFDQTG